MQANYFSFEQNNAEIIALVVEPQESVSAIVTAFDYPYPVLADADHAVSGAYGVYNLLGDSRATPSVFIVDESGVVAWAYVGQDFNDRPSVQQILDQLSPPPD